MQRILSNFKKFPRQPASPTIRWSKGLQGASMLSMFRAKSVSSCFWLQVVLIAAMLIVSSTVLFAQRTVTGRVTSQDDGQGMPGANIVIKGTTTGSVTDADGNYSIQVPSNESILVFSSIGYASQEVIVGTRTVIDVTMALDAKQLEEIVVVGYGTVRKSDVTGALSRVTSETIQERPAQNILQALQGKAAGVHVSSNFKPGELPVVRIRGNRSIQASNDPLYVVDGIPLIQNTLGVSSFTINDLNPNDIASIEILKDASATAIYGSRGANGVVLITTKKGTKGKVTVNYNTSVSIDRFKSLTDWMSGGEYIDKWRSSLINGRLYNKDIPNNGDLKVPAVNWYPDPELDKVSMNLASDPVVLESVMSGYEWNADGSVQMRPTTQAEKDMGWPDMVPVYNSKNIRSYDWIDDAVRTGVTQNHQISLTAGTDVSRMAISLGYHDMLGVQKDQDFKRFTGSISGDITPNKWLSLGTSISLSMSLQNFGITGPNTSNTGSKDLYSRATDQFPFNLPKNEDGSWRRFSQLNNQLFNPLIDIDQSLNERRTSAILVNMFGELTFTPWLKYRINFGPQFRQFRNGSWTGPQATNHLTNRPNTASYSTDQNFAWVAENLLFVDKTLGDHTIGVTLLQSAQKSRRENIGANVSNAVVDISHWYDLASNSNGRPDGYGSGFTENTLMSYMGRVNYTFRNRYLLTASGRYDGASVLAPGYKWHFFPSFAVAWKMHDEQFMQGFSWVNEFKPRFSYGVTGNSSVNPYTTSGPLSRNPYVFGSAPAIGYLPQLVKNSVLGWERTTQKNIGVDFGFIRNRISGSIELYEQNTSDLLLTKTLPAMSGYVQKVENIGKTQNRGIELMISTVNIEKPNFSWSMEINWSKNREEIVELMNGKEDMIGSGLFIGHPVNVYRQYQNAGIWQNTSEDLEEMAKFNANGHRFYPGTIKVVDQLTIDTDGDGIKDARDYRINGEDMVIRGNPRPKWNGGITNTFRYKNWQLSSFIYARWGQTYFGGYPNSYGGIWPNGRVENDMWSWDNPGGRWPMPNAGNVENITAAMQYNDGSFVTVRNISLSYTFPKSWIQKIAIDDLVLNFQVLNPFIFGRDVVKWGINPDDDTNWGIASSNTNPLGGTNNNTILPQSFVFGIRAGF